MDSINRIKDLREDKDMTQEEIATILHIKREVYNRYEKGKNMMPITHYIKLAVFYNISLDYICGLINEPRKLF